MGKHSASIRIRGCRTSVADAGPATLACKRATTRRGRFTSPTTLRVCPLQRGSFAALLRYGYVQRLTRIHRVPGYPNRAAKRRRQIPPVKGSSSIRGGRRVYVLSAIIAAWASSRAFAADSRPPLTPPARGGRIGVPPRVRGGSGWGVLIPRVIQARKRTPRIWAFPPLKGADAERRGGCWAVEYTYDRVWMPAP
jgi:hypothetical protein